METTTNEMEVLQAEIRAAREAVIKTAESDNLLSVIKNKVDPSGQKQGEIPDTRFNRRFKKRKLKELDTLVAQFLRFRSEQEDIEGEEVVEKLDYYDRIWKTLAEVHNKKKTNGFTLRYLAFKERVKYLLDVEAEQIKAAKEQYNHSLYARWWKFNSKNYKLRNILWNIFAFLTNKKVEDIRYAWYLKNIKTT
jgi:hypothetical protein